MQESQQSSGGTLKGLKDEIKKLNLDLTRSTMAAEKALQDYEKLKHTSKGFQDDL
jgi:hypothetical protein